MYRPIRRLRIRSVVTDETVDRLTPLVSVVRRSIALGAAFVLLTAAGPVQPYSFVPIDVPCNACPGGIARQTIAEGINAEGAIVGVYRDGSNAQRGFLLTRDGVTTIDVPGAIATVATGIDPAGDIVGRYTEAVGASPDCTVSGPQCIHGFLYSHGRFTTLRVDDHPGSFAQRIAPDGTIYGCLHDLDLMGSMFGAIWTRFGATSSLTAGGGELADSAQSLPASMNNGATPGGGVVVGHFTALVTGLTHGFIVRDGTLQVYDVPGSTLTQIWDINPEQQFVGTYKDGSGRQHGFVEVPGWGITTLDYPAAASTIAFGINPEGSIVGQYIADGRTRGFLAVAGQRVRSAGTLSPVQ